MSVHPVSRRRFLSQSLLAVGAPMLIPAGVLAAHGKPGANERITVGVIGIGGRANMLVDQLPAGAQVASVADCELPRCEQAAKRRKAKWRMHQDYRKLLDEKDLDGVIVGTPDHARVLVCVRACQAGKDIYAEKPLSLYIAEGRVLVTAARKYQRVFQVGTQQRSMETNRAACEFIRNGGLGKIKVVLGVNYLPRPQRYTALPEEAVPQGLNWDVWLGQTPLRTYNQKIHRGWMWFYDYSGMQMTNWGAHGLDQVQWALGMSTTGPVEFWPIKPGPDGAVAFRYANGVEVRLEREKGPMGGAIFRGAKGNIEINRNKYTTNPHDLIPNPPSKEDVKKWEDSTAMWQARFHIQNWLDCIKTRQKPVADVEIGHRSVSVCHLAGITRALGRKLRWDPDQEQFVGDAEANALVARPRRKGYELPDPV